jgi:hypothetical protein
MVHLKVLETLFDQHGHCERRLYRLRKNSICGGKATRGLKPARIPNALRGPEEPLFHGDAHILEFFRKL